MQADFPSQSAQNLGDSNTMRQPLRIAIVGGGCTGLKLAHLLARWQMERPDERSIQLVVFESSERLGGLIQTRRLPSGLKIEAAAQGVLASRTIFLETLEQLGFTPNDVISPPKDRQFQTRYVVSPRGKMAGLTGPLAVVRGGVLGMRALLRAAFEFFKPRQTPPQPNETLFNFVSRRFGRAVAENLIIPFATGIWGGGAEKLLVRHAFPVLPELELQHGSVIRGFIARRWRARSAHRNTDSWPKGLLSFPDGMQTLIEGFERALRQWAQPEPQRLALRLAQQVKSIGKTSDGKLLINDGEVFDTVFWTSVPWLATDLLWSEEAVQREWSRWSQIQAHSLVVLNVSGPRNPLTRDGFGVLARRESTGLLGVLFVHSIYPQHVPDGHYSYRVLLGGDRNPQMIQWPDAQIKEYGLAHLRELQILPAEVEPLDVQIIRWPRVVGIADEQHDERQTALWRMQAFYPQVFFAGIYRKGVGVADALLSAQDCFNEWQATRER